MSFKICFLLENLYFTGLTQWEKNKLLSTNINNRKYTKLRLKTLAPKVCHYFYFTCLKRWMQASQVSTGRGTRWGCNCFRNSLTWSGHVFRMTKTNLYDSGVVYEVSKDSSTLLNVGFLFLWVDKQQPELLS